MGGFADSVLGAYTIQVFLHSAVTAILADLSLLAWGIDDPAVKQRFRFIALALPPLLFPVFFFMFPERQEVLFRLNALFDSKRWLSLELFGSFSLWPVLIGIFALTTLIFIIQEVIPIFAHLLELRRSHPETDGTAQTEVHEEADETQEALQKKLRQAIEPLPVKEDLMEIIDDPDLYLYSSTGLRPSIYVSTGLIDELDTEALSAALAHEVAHILRSRKPSLLIAYLLRVLMFFNPPAMLVFRKMAQEEEQVCDDFAVRLVGNPESLARAVELFRSQSEEGQIHQEAGSVAKATASLEHYSHDLLLQNRISRIRKGIPDVSGQWRAPFTLTLLTSIGMNYFIV